VVRKIVHLRWKHRLGPVQIAAQVGLAPSTVHQVLVRCKINRLSGIDRVTGEPVRRYEHDRPGSLIHPRRQSSATTRRRRMALRRPGPGQAEPQGHRPPHRPAQPEIPPSAHRTLIGAAFIHTVLDDHSRVAYAEVRADQTRETAASVLRNAVDLFTTLGARRGRWRAP